MLEYWLMLSGKYPPATLRQAVLYAGYRKMSMASGLSYPRLKFSYVLKDIREFDPEEILASPLPSERALALLCGRAEPRRTLPRILESWAGLSVQDWGSLFDTLMTVSGSRKAEAAVEEATKTMPLTDEFIRENTVLQKWLKQGLKQGLEQGREEGVRQGLRRGEATLPRRQIERRFGTVPQWALQCIEKASSRQLETWALQLLDAAVIEDVFA